MRSLLQLALLRIAVGAWALGTRLGRRRLARSAEGAFEQAAARAIGAESERRQQVAQTAPGDPPSGYRQVEARAQLSAAVGSALLLVDEQARLFVPIFVGPGEALAFQHRLAGTSFGRPLPYDLLDRLLAEIGGRVLCARVEALRNNVFSACLELLVEGERVVELDARASDAVIVALGAGAPIYASDALLREVGRPLGKG